MKRLSTTTTTTLLVFLLYFYAPLSAFCFTKAAPPRARRRWQSSPSSSTKYVHNKYRCCRHSHSSTTSLLRMTSQAVDLSSGLGTDASFPQCVPLVESPAGMGEATAVAKETPAPDHAELGLHLRFGPKVLPL